MISAGIVTVSYIAATVLFILALGGLSNQETARRGNWYGIVGMINRLTGHHLRCGNTALRDYCWERSLSVAASVLFLRDVCR